MDQNFSFRKEKSCFEIKQDQLEQFTQGNLNPENNHIVDEEQSGYEDSRWTEKSKEIKARDNYTCQLCHAFNPSLDGYVILQQGDYETVHDYYWAGDNYYQIHIKSNFSLSIIFRFKPYYHLVMPRLNVHHKVYYRNRKIWDYQDDELVTLCERCHHYVHALKNIGIPIVEQDANGKITLVGRTSPKPYNPQIDHTDLSTFKPFSIVKENLWGYGLQGDDLIKFKRSKKQGKKWYDYQEVLDNDILDVHSLSFEKMSDKTHEEIKCVAEFIINDFINNILGYKTGN